MIFLQNMVHHSNEAVFLFQVFTLTRNTAVGFEFDSFEMGEELQRIDQQIFSAQKNKPILIFVDSTDRSQPINLDRRFLPRQQAGEQLTPFHSPFDPVNNEIGTSAEDDRNPSTSVLVLRNERNTINRFRGEPEIAGDLHRIFGSENGQRDIFTSDPDFQLGAARPRQNKRFRPFIREIDNRIDIDANRGIQTNRFPTIRQDNRHIEQNRFNRVKIDNNRGTRRFPVANKHEIMGVPAHRFPDISREVNGLFPIRRFPEDNRDVNRVFPTSRFPENNRDVNRLSPANRFPENNRDINRLFPTSLFPENNINVNRLFPTSRLPENNRDINRVSPTSRLPERNVNRVFPTNRFPENNRDVNRVFPVSRFPENNRDINRVFPTSQFPEDNRDVNRVFPTSRFPENNRDINRVFPTNRFPENNRDVNRVFPVSRFPENNRDINRVFPTSRFPENNRDVNRVFPTSRFPENNRDVNRFSPINRFPENNRDVNRGLPTHRFPSLTENRDSHTISGNGINTNGIRGNPNRQQNNLFNTGLQPSIIQSQNDRRFQNSNNRFHNIGQNINIFKFDPHLQLPGRTRVQDSINVRANLEQLPTQTVMGVFSQQRFPPFGGNSFPVNPNSFPPFPIPSTGRFPVFPPSFLNNNFQVNNSI